MSKKISEKLKRRNRSVDGMIILKLMLKRYSADWIVWHKAEFIDYDDET
jgi:hypothetical protein